MRKIDLKVFTKQELMDKIGCFKLQKEEYDKVVKRGGKLTPFQEWDYERACKSIRYYEGILEEDMQEYIVLEGDKLVKVDMTILKLLK